LGNKKHLLLVAGFSHHQQGHRAVKDQQGAPQEGAKGQQGPAAEEEASTANKAAAAGIARTHAAKKPRTLFLFSLEQHSSCSRNLTLLASYSARRRGRRRCLRPPRSYPQQPLPAPASAAGAADSDHADFPVGLCPGVAPPTADADHAGLAVGLFPAVPDRRRPRPRPRRRPRLRPPHRASKGGDEN
jgi:hypothetical protein